MAAQPTGAAREATVEPSASQKGADDDSWSLGASVYAYFVPDSPDYIQPTITADRGGIHLEGRVNYEDIHTASAWIGWNWSAAGTVSIELTPMAGVFVGDISGVAPGYEGTLSWRKLELYSEGEYAIDPGNSANSFFYNWTTLTLEPTEGFRFGVVVEHTRAYHSSLEIQRGFIVGFSFKQVSATAQLLNPDLSVPTYVLSMSADF